MSIIFRTFKGEAGGVVLSLTGTEPGWRNPTEILCLSY